jgi:formylglycine-generating enzyme required for sulfatase activity
MVRRRASTFDGFTDGWKMQQLRFLFAAVVALSSASFLRGAPLFNMQTSQVPYDPGDPATQRPSGPEYTFNMGRFEVTVSQYIAFLNDAEGNQDNERGANLAFRSWGDVGLPAERPVGTPPGRVTRGFDTTTQDEPTRGCVLARQNKVGFKRFQAWSTLTIQPRQKGEGEDDPQRSI